jgi:5-amino-6-(5-phosphoribosylamino)uracil reductase
MEFRQLLPQPESFELEPRLADLDLGSSATDRPYTVANFIASADGRATFAGRSGQLGDDGDKAMFHGLREQVDAVMVGTGTLRVERYGRILNKPERRERRVERGRSPEPLACVITRSGAVPLDAPLFANRDSRIVIYTSSPIDTADCTAQVETVRLDPTELTGTTVVRHLLAEFGVHSLLCEGGPSIFAALVGEGLVDELFLTLAPKLTGGGEGPNITTGPELHTLCPLEPIWALERAGALYLRYRIINP